MRKPSLVEGFSFEFKLKVGSNFCLDQISGREGDPVPAYSLKVCLIEEVI
jgi:hypothetical protein